MPYQELSGFKQATDTYNQLATQNINRLNALSQADYRDRQMQLQEEKARQLQKEKEKADYENWEREQILNKVADSKYEDMLQSGQIDSSTLLAQRAKAAAQESLRMGKTKFADGFLKQAAEYEKESAIMQDRQRQLQQQKMNRVLEEQPKDAVDWAYIKPRLAEAGIEIPREFQSWSPGTEKWFNTKALQVDTVRKAAQLQDNLQIAQDKQRLAEEKQAHKVQQDADKARAEATNREFKRRAKAIAGPLDTNKLAVQLKSYFDEGTLSTLEDDDKIKAANELESMARDKYLSADSEVQDMAQARQWAANQLTSRVKDGKLLPADTGQVAVSTAVASPKSQAEFDALPSGTKFINPADGRQLIKK